MIRSRQGGRAASVVNRVVLGIALAALLQGCVAGLPRRRPGSNITLPQPPASLLADLLLGGCDSPIGSPQTRARDVVECKRTPYYLGSEPDPRSLEVPKAP
jgi:hypothetical protein